MKFNQKFYIWEILLKHLKVFWGFDKEKVYHHFYFVCLSTTLNIV